MAMTKNEDSYLANGKSSGSSLIGAAWKESRRTIPIFLGDINQMWGDGDDYKGIKSY